jgi:DNA-binding IclR family transcriptional regulator
MPKSKQPARKGIKSVEVASRILSALTQSPEALSLKQLANAAGISSSLARTHAVSLIRTGLLEQTDAYGRYNLGPFASRLGLAAIARIDSYEVMESTARQLREETKLTVAAAVWSSNGPVLVIWLRGARQLPLNVNVGSTLPMISTALGRVFLAYLSADDTRAIAQREQRELGRDARKIVDGSISDLAGLAAQIRRVGYATSRSTLFPEMLAIAAPLLRSENHVVAAIGVIGSGSFQNAGGERKVTRALLKAVRRASERLGQLG